MLNQSVKLTSNRREITKTVFAVQSDSGRNLYMQLDDRVLNGDELAVFCAVKPSGAMIYNNCTIEEYLGEMTAVCKLTTQALAEVGLTKAQLQITDADGIATSYYFYINVEEKVIDDSAVESSDEFTALQAIVNEFAEIKTNKQDKFYQNPLYRPTLTKNEWVTIEIPTPLNQFQELVFQQTFYDNVSSSISIPRSIFKNLTSSGKRLILSACEIYYVDDTHIKAMLTADSTAYSFALYAR